MLARQLSNTLDGVFRLDALRQALNKGRPKIFNTDQGAQFTADAFTTTLLAANIQVSMDGRALDTSSANVSGAASNMKTSISASMTLYVSCTLG